jgi:3-methyladenine DNA glycosylase AlkD
MRARQVCERLMKLGDPTNVEGMARYGISTSGTLGVSVPELRRLAKEIGTDHDLALELWDTGFHEARILAPLIADPSRVTPGQLDRWVSDVDSWDVCDQLCNNLVRKTRFAHNRIGDWCGSEREFVRRAGFVMIAVLAVHDKKATDKVFDGYLRLIADGATDERNLVKKAVNWALRAIGKRNAALNGHAVAKARELAESDSKAARWIARDALRELTSEKVRERLTKKHG